jgi:hypothetical protein
VSNEANARPVSMKCRGQVQSTISGGGDAREVRARDSSRQLCSDLTPESNSELQQDGDMADTVASEQLSNRYGAEWPNHQTRLFQQQRARVGARTLSTCEDKSDIKIAAAGGPNCREDKSSPIHFAGSASLPPHSMPVKTTRAIARRAPIKLLWWPLKTSCSCGQICCLHRRWLSVTDLWA